MADRSLYSVELSDDGRANIKVYGRAETRSTSFGPFRLIRVVPITGHGGDPEPEIRAKREYNAVVRGTWIIVGLIVTEIVIMVLELLAKR